MKKIPTLFARNHDGDHRVRDEVGQPTVGLPLFDLPALLEPCGGIANGHVGSTGERPPLLPSSQRR